jgi:hypothetical protein
MSVPTAAFAAAGAAGAGAETAGDPHGSAINAAAANKRDVLMVCSKSHVLCDVKAHFSF